MPPDFDGKADASVRVQASRVRKHLEEYYETEGAMTPCASPCRAGRTYPSSSRTRLSARELAVVPGVVVAILASSGDEPAGAFARSMTESLVQHLAAHGHIRVVGPIEGDADPSRSAAAANVGSILTGHVAVRGQRLSLTLRLHDALSSEVLWSDEQSVDLEALAGFEVEQRWAKEIAAMVGDPAGPVIRQELARSRPPRPLRSSRRGSRSTPTWRRGRWRPWSTRSPPWMPRSTRADARPRCSPCARRWPTRGASTSWPIATLELDRAENLAREALLHDAGHVHATSS